MVNLIKTMFSSWMTAIPGALALVCASADLIGVIPEMYSTVALHVCGILTALGVIAAKDANKSNAPVPSTTPNVVRPS